MTLYLKMVFPQHDILFSELWFRSEFPLDGSLIPRNTVFFSCQAREKPAWLPQSCLGESPWCLCLTSVCACARLCISCSLCTASETCFFGVCYSVFRWDLYWKRQKPLVHMVGIWFWLCGLHTFQGWDLLLHVVFCGTCFILLSWHVPFGRAPFYPSCGLPVCSQGCLNPWGGI